MSDKNKPKSRNTKRQKRNSFADTFGSLKIKIPARLSSKVAHSYELRASLDTWLILKAAFESGKVDTTKEKREALEILCGRDFKTLEKRLKHLHQLQLCEYTTESGFATLRSWEKLAEVFEYEMKGNYYVRYDGTKRVSDILEAKFMYEKESQCKAAFHYKLNKFEDIRRTVQDVADGTNSEAVQYSQLYHYLREYSLLSEEERFALYEIARADTSLSYRKWSEYFDYNSKGGFAYKKRKLVQAGLITVEKRRWIIKGTHKSRKLRKSILGTAPYVPKLKEVIFFMPDKLQYLSASVSLPIAKLEAPALNTKAA